MNWRINYESINTINVNEAYENDCMKFMIENHIITLRVQQTWALFSNIVL